MLARSYGPSGQRSGATGADMTTTPSSGMAIELPGQQRHLRPVGPGMRHHLGGRLAVAFDGVELDVNARRNDQAVIRDAVIVADPHSLGLRINSSHPSSCNRDARSGNFLVAKLLGGERA